MTQTPRRFPFAAPVLILGLCLCGSLRAAEPSNAAADAGAAVAGAGKSSYWSRDNARLPLAGVLVAAPQWSAEVNADDSRFAFTPEEQQELVQHLRDALDRLVALPSVPLHVDPAASPTPLAGPPVAATSVGASAALRLQARITQASMPNIARNVLVMAIPLPIPGIRSLFRSRGGAAIDVALVRPGETEPTASFQCEHQVGLISLLDSYRRLAQAKTAMARCVEMLALSAPEGRLVESAPIAAAPATLPQP